MSFGLDFQLFSFKKILEIFLTLSFLHVFWNPVFEISCHILYKFFIIVKVERNSVEFWNGEIIVLVYGIPVHVQNHYVSENLMFMSFFSINKIYRHFFKPYL